MAFLPETTLSQNLPQDSTVQRLHQLCLHCTVSHNQAARRGPGPCDLSAVSFANLGRGLFVFPLPFCSLPEALLHTEIFSRSPGIKKEGSPTRLTSDYAGNGLLGRSACSSQHDIGTSGHQPAHQSAHWLSHCQPLDVNQFRCMMGIPTGIMCWCCSLLWCSSLCSAQAGYLGKSFGQVMAHTAGVWFPKADRKEWIIWALGQASPSFCGWALKPVGRALTGPLQRWSANGPRPHTALGLHPQNSLPILGSSPAWLNFRPVMTEAVH